MAVENVKTKRLQSIAIISVAAQLVLSSCVPIILPCEDKNACPEPHKGQCTAIENTAVCSCDPGYTDFGDGACKPTNPCAGETPCAGQHRVCVNQQGTAACGECVGGYHDESGTCVEDTECEENTCNHHGTCDDSSGRPVCICEPGYAGANCEGCDTANGYHLNAAGTGCTNDPCDIDPFPCTEINKGQCTDNGGAPVCGCDAGYTDYGDGACRPTDPCAGETTCIGQHRVCDNQQGTPACGECVPGYHDKSGICEEDTECEENTCNQHGDCDDSTGESVCTCNAG